MSQANIDTLANRLGTGPTNLFKQWAAKAWANLNGTGTIALRDSENISSVTDNGTGTYTFNFSSAFANTGYSRGGGSGSGNSGGSALTSGPIASISFHTTGSSRYTSLIGATVTDFDDVSMASTGDLA